MLDLFSLHISPIQYFILAGLQETTLKQDLHKLQWVTNVNFLVSGGCLRRDVQWDSIEAEKFIQIPFPESALSI